MALTRHLTLTEPLPHEPGEWFRFKFPSFTEVEAAREARRLQGLRTVGSTRGALGDDLWDKLTRDRELRQAEEAEKRKADGTPEDAPTTAPKPEDEFDALTLLNGGIAAWSYCEPYTAEDAPSPDLVGTPNPAKPVPVTPEQVADLDPITKQWAFLTLVELCINGTGLRRRVVVEPNARGVLEVRVEAGDPLPSGASSIGI